jgi:hypothetical protein
MSHRGHDGVRAWIADVQENFERFDPSLDEHAQRQRSGCCQRRDQISGEGEWRRYG